MVSIALGVMAVTWSAGLLSDRLPSGVRLLDDADGAAAPAPPRSSSSLIGPGELEAMSGPQLQMKYEALRADRPGVGGPVAALVLSNILPVLAVFVPSSAAVLALVLVVGGVVLGIVGTVTLIVNIVGMARHGHAMRLVRDQLALRALPRPPPSVPALVAPPPAPEEKRPAGVEPAPPEGALPRVEPRLVLAAF